jgi:hypothetical protein
MKSKFIIGSSTLVLLLTAISCGQDYVDSSRVYVEGKITSQNQSVNNIPLRLENSYYLLSKGNTANDGSFRLGGPEATSETELVLNKKIVSFSADQQGCTLREDSLSIILPEERHYVKFSNITIE